MAKVWCSSEHCKVTSLVMRVTVVEMPSHEIPDVVLPVRGGNSPPKKQKEQRGHGR